MDADPCRLYTYRSRFADPVVDPARPDHLRLEEVVSDVPRGLDLP